ncbi:MAG: DUF3575 domain-containing protein [Tannerellaceae bacterium]|nr:DUF3575 domain-containing protein [Tannerellaceae bacterium]
MKNLKPQLRILLLLVLFAALVAKGWANEPVYPPRIGIKTNLLYWATTTPNLSLEYAFSERITLDVSGSYNPWQFGSREKNKKIKHWTVQPEVKYWLCEKFNGSFLGLHAHYGRFNAGGVKLPFDIWKGLSGQRYEGYLTGGGISYGYQWYLSSRWNLEAEFSFGYAYVNYKEYECRRCGDYIGRNHHHYFGPTRVGVSLVYFFK